VVQWETLNVEVPEAGWRAAAGALQPVWDSSPFVPKIPTSCGRGGESDFSGRV